MSINISSTLDFNVGIGLFSICIMLIILFNIRNKYIASQQNTLFQFLSLATLFTVCADAICWLVNGKAGTLMIFANYATNIIYFILQIVTATFWLFYVWYEVFGTTISTRKKVMCIYTPVTLFSLLILTTPLNGLSFYVDSQNYYHRGPLAYIVSLLAMGILLLATALAISQYKKAISHDQKSELLAIALFPVAPLAAGIIQLCYFGISLVWPSVTLSCLLIMCNRHQTALSKDPLTGLKNRRCLENLSSTFGGYGISGSTAVIMLDLNKFKEINDKYGHHIGDLALIKVAEIIRTAFNDKRSFLARYGGDEFVIITNQDEASPDKILNRIETARNAFNEKSEFPFEISFSIGCIMSPNKDKVSLQDLLIKADREMYTAKGNYYKKQHERRASRPTAGTPP